jgi:iron complex transport system ATP-binding protein
MEKGSIVVRTAPYGHRSAFGAAASAAAYLVQSVRFRYRAGSHREASWVLDGLTFQVEPGEVLGIVGPNGSGKSSLLKLLAKVLQPQEGKIEMFGRELTSLAQDEIARAAALVPQDSQQIFPFTVLETVLMGRYPHHERTAWAGFGWENEEDLAVAEQAMAAADIRHLAGRAVTDLSGGERQRCVIARALAQRPDVLLLDEPTAFLDLPHQIDICTIVRRQQEERGLTVILVSHDLTLASQYCDRILMLKEGRLFRLGTPEEVIRPEVIRDVYGCEVLVDRHPESGLPRVTLPARSR